MRARQRGQRECPERRASGQQSQRGLGLACGFVDVLVENCEDECVEITPETVRIRKVILDQNERAKIASRARKANK
jgi:predicted membrane GTPase involved in stress response